MHRHKVHVGTTTVPARACSVNHLLLGNWDLNELGGVFFVCVCELWEISDGNLCSLSRKILKLSESECPAYHGTLTLRIHFINTVGFDLC